MDMVCGSLDQNAQANYKGAAKFLESKRLRDGRERACCLSSEYLTTDAEWNTRDRELWRTSAIHLFKGKTKQQRRQLGKGPGNSGEPDGGTLRAVLGHGIAPKSGAWEAHEKRREQVVRGAFREEGGAGQESGSSYRRGESGREGTGRGSWGHRKGQGLVWKNKMAAIKEAGGGKVQRPHDSPLSFWFCRLLLGAQQGRD